MGGLVSLEAVRSGIRPARLALSSPLLGVTVQTPKIKILAGRLLSRIAPSVAMKNAIDPTALSRDLEVGTAYVADPLVFDTITPRWYTEMMATVANVLAEPSWPVPLAMFTGTDDRVVDANVNKEFALKNRAYLRVYPDFRHEILNEIGKEQVTADIIGWLEGDAACATG
jgi:alpha-beta hydrolase superfamily lysophospholipase